MTQVIARNNESFESLWKRFKRAVEHENVLADLRKHEYYEKPSVKRKRKSAAARKRERLANKGKPSKVRNINFKFNEDKTKKTYNQPHKGTQQYRPQNRRPRKD